MKWNPKDQITMFDLMPNSVDSITKKREGINVLSLFDGMSCGRVALERAGIDVASYYASEVDKSAIEVSRKNYPDIIQLGDVTKWREWDLPEIDLIIGGSPCQGFSFAGKQLNFDDPRSKLFFEFADIVNFHKPEYFFLENVKMKKESQDIITGYLGVEPILINSALVSAQNRERLYWTNISGIEQPKDKGIFLKDIVLEDAEPVALHNIYGGFKEKSVRVFEGKSPTLRTAAGGGHIPSFVKKSFGMAVRGRYKNGTKQTHQVVEFNGTEKANALTTVQKDSMRFELSEDALNFIESKLGEGNNSATNIATEVARVFKGTPYSDFKELDCIRRYDPIECERLQTLPDNYTEGVSNTQRYRMIGNGWTVDVISHIFQSIKVPAKN